MLFRSLVFLLTLFVVPSCYSQQDSSRTHRSDIASADASSFFHDAGAVVTSPLRFSATDWVHTAKIVGGTALLCVIDEPARSLSQKNQSTFGGHVASVGREYGREVNAFMFSGGVYVSGLVFKNTELRKSGLMMFESVVFAGTITTVIKSLVGRSRPYTDEGATRFSGFQFKHQTTSLPSGHSTVAFAMSTVLAGRIKNTYATVGLYSLATLTALSRVYDDEHWISDTFLGAAIGTCVGVTVLHLNEDRGDDMSFHLSPTPDGITVAVVF